MPANASWPPPSDPRPAHLPRPRFRFRFRFLSGNPTENSRNPLPKVLRQDLAYLGGHPEAGTVTAGLASFTLDLRNGYAGICSVFMK